MAVDTAYKRRAIRRTIRQIIAPDSQIAGPDRLVLLGRYYLAPAADVEDAEETIVWVRRSYLKDASVYQSIADVSFVGQIRVSDVCVSRTKSAVSRLT